ncbi:alpha/beta hydrolase [Larkinella humicola]|uniref:Alpha/beta hydrolase n=1 Tax=Larkinella humicola TaxID=2607654 RepID=A0A5N1J0Y7_9BACT|nr:alpha/beta hydrolase [Larkinella humicola]KAA9340375.1 alpha/beta hydrolase [Larkinella humicola]
MSSINKNLLFIQGGGSTEDYEADKKLVDTLQGLLGEAYGMHYPLLPNESIPDLGRIKQIDNAISLIEGELILVGHSLGASMLLKYVSENEIRKKITGIFLLSTPFWSGEEEWKKGFKLKEDFADQLPSDIPVFLYHCQDDQEVPFAHFAIYRKKLPWATFRELASGGHQLNNDLTIVANDILAL